MRRILLIGLGVVVFTVVLSLITAKLLAGPEELPQEVSLITAVTGGNHLVRLSGEGVGLLYYDQNLTYNIIYLSSEDDGATWGEPDTLNASPYLNMIEPPDMQVGPDGDLYAVWDGADGTRGDSTDVFFARWSSAAELWGVPEKVAGGIYLAAGPRLAVAGDGTLHAVWYDESDTESDIMYMRSSDGGETWSTPAAIDGVDGFAQTPTVTVDGDGAVHAAFVEIIDIGAPDYLGDEVHWVMSADGGDTWDAPVAVSGHGGVQSALGAALPTLGVDTDNALHLAWVDDDGVDRDIYHARRPAGGAWSAPADVSASAALSYFPDLAPDAAGRVHLLYQEGDWGDSGETFYAYFDGDWSTPQNLSVSESDSRGPTMAPETGSAGFLAAWLEATGSFRIEFLLSPEVWPGDTDNNGLVDALDVVPLALYWGETGPARQGGGQQSWTAKPALPWVTWEATYADANGDGLVDARDVLPLGLNWALAHEVRGPSLAPPLEEMDHRPYLAAYRELRESLAGSGDSAPARAMIQLLDGLISRAEDPGSFGHSVPVGGAATPNPAGDGETRISFSLDEPGQVEVAIYDPRGRLVRNLLQERRDRGPHEVGWDGSDERGRPVPAGLYLCRITVPGGSTTAKILWLR